MTNTRTLDAGVWTFSVANEAALEAFFSQFGAALPAEKIAYDLDVEGEIPVEVTLLQQTDIDSAVFAATGNWSRVSDAKKSTNWFGLGLGAAGVGLALGALRRRK